VTPLQNQKQMSLLQARRLTVTDAISFENAPFEVGYESPSQFSREYSRMFGARHRRKVSALKSMTSYGHGNSAGVNKSNLPGRKTSSRKDNPSPKCLLNGKRF